MPGYNRRFYRRTNRRYKRKGSKVLNKTSIFSRTNAKSQARQINALRRKVNAIAYANKPEIKIYDSGYLTAIPFHRTFNNSALSKTHDAWRMYIPDQGVETDKRIGDTFKCLSHQWIVNLQYHNDSSTGFHQNTPSCAVVRFTVVQFKAAKFSLQGVPGINTIFSYFHSNQEPNYPLITDSPFMPGFSTDKRCLYDKKVYLTPDHPVKDFVINVHPKYNLINVPLDPLHDEEDAPDHKNIMALYICVGNLQWNADFKETVDLNMQRKLVYTDA